MMFNCMYNILKSNIYSSTFKQKNKILLAKDLKHYRVFNWLYIKLYTSGNLINYLHKLAIDNMTLINVLRVVVILFVISFLF
jgi:hypothetical protein